MDSKGTVDQNANACEGLPASELRLKEEQR
jgi:hypothetical protein